MATLNISKVLLAISSNTTGIGSVINRLENAPEFKKGSISKTGVDTYINQLIDHNLVDKIKGQGAVLYKKRPHAKERLQKILALEA
jgi:predicted transcriptional regulator